MFRIVCSLLICVASAASVAAQSADALAGRRVVFLGDSITQSGGYVTVTAYYLNKLYPEKKFDIYGLGLSSETLSGLSEANHAGGKFPRPCLFERLSRLLEGVRPEVVFACYGMNDGIYLPLDTERFSAFRTGVTRLVESCQAAGVQQIFLITPPIYDFAAPSGEFQYDTVLSEYAAWETSLKLPGVQVIDLHSAMRSARDARTEPFSKDRVHPGDEGHFFMARTLLAALGEKLPDQTFEELKTDPLYKLVAEQRGKRSAAWMKHIGYTREKTFEPQPLGDIEAEVARLQAQIDALRKQPR